MGVDVYSQIEYAHYSGCAPNVCGVDTLPLTVCSCIDNP